jgi:hypothetical protein
MDLLDKEISGGKERHTVFAFLGNAIKDHGAVPQCIQLYRYLPLWKAPLYLPSPAGGCLALCCLVVHPKTSLFV